MPIQVGHDVVDEAQASDRHKWEDRDDESPSKGCGRSILNRIRTVPMLRLFLYGLFLVGLSVGMFLLGKSRGYCCSYSSVVSASGPASPAYHSSTSHQLITKGPSNAADQIDNSGTDSVSADQEWYLKSTLPATDKRYGTYGLALKLMRDRNIRTIVQTGPDWGADQKSGGDGGSTSILAIWAKDHNADLYTVDSDQKRVDLARANALGRVKRYSGSLQFTCSDSVKYLAEFGKTIDFLYLHSYGIEPAHIGEMQMQHLREVESAYPYLRQESVVMVDECYLPTGGKCFLVVDYLQARGWKILMQRYQVVLVRVE